MTPLISQLETMKEELRRSQKEASRSQRLLLAFSQAAQAVQCARTPSEVYRTVGEQVIGLGFNAVVFSLTPDRANLTISHTTFEPTLLWAAARVTGLSVQDYRMPLVPGGFYQRIMAEGQSIFADRNRTAEIIVEGLPGPLGRLAGRLATLLRIEQSIAARLTVGGEAHGVLLITGNDLTEADVPAVTAFASQTAVCLENAWVEEKLRKSEERYRAFITATAQVVWTTNAGGEVVGDLPSWREFTGQSEEAIKGWGWIEAIHPEDRERAAQVWKKAVETKCPLENEFRVRKYDGSYQLFFARGIPVLEVQGNIREWVGTCTDITERKRAEAELNKHREHLEELVEERTAKLKRVNEALEAEITERKRAEAEMAERRRLETLVAEVGVALAGAESLRQGLQQCAEIMARDINAAFARIWTVNEEHKVLELEASAGMYTHLDGGHARVPMGQFKIGRIAENGEPHLTNTVQQDSWVGDPEWARREGMVAFAGYPLRVGEHVLGVVAAFARQPLTPATLQAFASVAHNLAQFIKRKRAEEALRESEEKYRALIETTGTGYVIIDMQGRVIDANPEYVRLAGRRALQEILGRRVTEWTAQHDLARNAEAVRRCAELGFVRNLEIEYVNGDGKCTPIEVNATVVPAAGDVRIVGLCRDITERKRAEQALREAEEQLRSLFAATPCPPSFGIWRRFSTSRLMTLPSPIPATPATSS